MSKAKSFSISKQAIWRAYERVKAKGGSSGADRQTIADFERNLKKNLYKIWNRMSSGTYFPPPVKTVAIPKKDGGRRMLGIPTVADRIAQTVVKEELEPVLDPLFHEDSYGYRPGKSAHQAVETAKQRCWRNPWVIDLDIKGFFDNIDHDLLLRAVKHHTKCEWILLYVERWLKAGTMAEDGTVTDRLTGTPQGGVVSPLLANLFLHYVFDAWMGRAFPGVKFERYADDIIVHCRSLQEAQRLKGAIECRMIECGLALNPEKTQLVFCQNRMKTGEPGYASSFDFLGFTFRQRTAKGPNGKRFDGFMPAISETSRKNIRDRMKHWGVQRSSHLSIREISERFNPVIRGWVGYFGKFYPRELRTLRTQWHQILTKWAMRKYKHFNRRRTNAGQWINEIQAREPKLFAFWETDGE